jgi:Uma2 family endonuclease
MSMASIKRFTADDVRALPDDGKRYETVHGELLVSPSPRRYHQIVLGRLYLTLGNYLADHGIEELLLSPSDISFDEDTLVQPDLFVADCSGQRTHEWSDIHTLHLVVEVLSPSTARADRLVKRRLYQEQRIETYWIVDAKAEQVEIWTPDATEAVIERDRLVWWHPQIAETCTVDLRKVFAPWGGTGDAVVHRP